MPTVYFGQVLPANTGSDLVADITAAISGNIAEVLTVFGFMVGVFLVLGLLRRAARGSV